MTNDKSHIDADDDSDVTRVKTSDDGLLLDQQPTRLPEQAANTTDSHSDLGRATSSELGIGSVVKNTYELVQVLGEGGMGSVFKALNKDWAEVGARDPYVALKILKPELSDNKDLVMGLFREFDRIKMLSDCPNNIKVHDFGRDGANVFMTMEYLTGQTLSEYINRQPTTLAHAWFIIEGVGNALAFAHKHNIVHRDIKPGNIFITKEGIVKVLDFGIASKINENEDDRTKFNGDDIGAFTLAYASPDTRLGDPPDCRDDIYSFACVIYEILTGKKFFDPKRRSRKAEPIHGLNNKQMEALNKALAFERDMRTPSIGELLDKLRPVKSEWSKYAGLGGLALLVLGGGLWGINVLTSHESAKEQTPASTSTQSVNTPAIPKPPVPEVKTPTPEPVVVQPPVSEVKTPIPEPVVVQPPVPEVKTPTPEPVVVLPPEPEVKILTNDNILNLHTSKPEYKNGQAFQVSFTLSQPSYVRVIDRDANGVITVLRPNPRQPDKLLPADEEHIFPPKGVTIPVSGTGTSTVTVVSSPTPFAKNFKLLNDEGGILEQIKSGSYSWAQVSYELRY
jgi:serine/threonine protein kinase